MSQETLKQRIETDMKSALRNREKERLGTVRLILAAIKQREVDERITLDDGQVLAVLDKMVKQRRDSIAQYEGAGRNDLADQEKYELGIIQAYLPVALSDAELDTLVDQAVAASGAASVKDMGKAMALLRPQVQGRGDMGAVSAKLKAKLSG